MDKKRITQLIVMTACLMVFMIACTETTQQINDNTAEAHALGIIAFFQEQHGMPTPELPPTIPTLSVDLTSAAPKPFADALPGRIAFTYQWEEGYWTFDLIENDGVTITQLTNDKRETSPISWSTSGIAWSPDGEKLAIQSNREGGNSEIYVMNSNGTEQIRLTNNNLENEAPVWSPDGKQILVVTYVSKNSEINKISADGSHQFQLTNSPAYDFGPVWSPDGQFIYFVSDRDGGREIYRMNADGSQQTRLTEDSEYGTSLAISPDGSSILFVSMWSGISQIFIMNTDGSGLKSLTNRTPLYKNRESDAVWSPDGKQIAFIGMSQKIYSVPADGSQPPFDYNTPSVIGDFTWSPDSKYIVFSSSGQGIYVLNVESSKIQLLFEAPNTAYPVWSPVCSERP